MVCVSRQRSQMPMPPASKPKARTRTRKSLASLPAIAVHSQDQNVRKIAKPNQGQGRPASSSFGTAGERFALAILFPTEISQLTSYPIQGDVESGGTKFLARCHRLRRTVITHGRRHLAKKMPGHFEQALTSIWES